MKWKILIGISILLICMGIVCAEEIPEFKVPGTLSPLGNTHAAYADGQGHNIFINEYNDENFKTWFENDTANEYLVEPYSKNTNFYLYAEGDTDCGVLEIVEKDGHKYIVGSWTPKGASEADVVVKNLREFNTLNKLEPIAI